MSEQRPTLWRCSRCLYGFWSYHEEQDPIMGHCRNGVWLKNKDAVDAIAEAAWNGYEREYWMGPING